MITHITPSLPASYDKNTSTATLGFYEKINDLIKRQSYVSFSEWMEWALYHPSHGYYSKGTQQIGKKGDFFTSVSVGTLFGEIIAQRCLTWWHQQNEPSAWCIAELAAHDGTLAHDILSTIKIKNEAAFKALEYTILEPLENLEQSQRKKLELFSEHISWIPSANASISKPLKPTILFANELLDALPFHLIEQVNGLWQEKVVTLDASNAFSWALQSISSQSKLANSLAQLTESLPQYHFEHGYTTEVRTNFNDLLQSISPLLEHPASMIILIDYGFASPEYYLPERTNGTMQTFYQHQKNDLPLESPGEKDITAHVDFTAFTLAAQSLGWQPNDFRSQGHWLIDHGKSILLNMEKEFDLKRINQLQSLTHPAHMGSAFHVLELTKTPLSSVPKIILQRLAL